MRINEEVLHSVDTIQRALFRKKKTTKACSMNCNSCLIQNFKDYAIDLHGTNYNYLTFDCNAKSVIYAIECQMCNVLYIGQTRSAIKTRLSAHLSNIRKMKNTSISRHFNAHDHIVMRDLKISLLDHIKPSNSGLNIREAAWIHTLNTIAEGINEKDEARCSLEYQTLAIARHFRHSISCLPVVIPRMINITTLNLQLFKRVPWVRTQHPRNDQSANAAHTAVGLPHIPRIS
jgi:hypothetical protein